MKLHPRRRNATLTTPTKIQKIQRANPALPDDRVSSVTKDIWTSDREFRHSELQIQSCDGANFQRRRPITTINSRVNRTHKQMRERTDNPTTNASELSHAATELNPVTFRTPVWDKTPISGSNAKGVDVNTTSIPKGMRINVTNEKNVTIDRETADRRPDPLDDNESETSGSAPVRERLYPTIPYPPPALAPKSDNI